jgi:hypothetical protein
LRITVKCLPNTPSHPPTQGIEGHKRQELSSRDCREACLHPGGPTASHGDQGQSPALPPASAVTLDRALELPRLTFNHLLVIRRFGLLPEAGERERKRLPAWHIGGALPLLHPHHTTGTCPPRHSLPTHPGSLAPVKSMIQVYLHGNPL